MSRGLTRPRRRDRSLVLGPSYGHPYGDRSKFTLLKKPTPLPLAPSVNPLSGDQETVPLASLTLSPSGDRSHWPKTRCGEALKTQPCRRVPALGLLRWLFSRHSQWGQVTQIGALRPGQFTSEEVLARFQQPTHTEGSHTRSLPEEETGHFRGGLVGQISRKQTPRRQQLLRKCQRTVIHRGGAVFASPGGAEEPKIPVWSSACITLFPAANKWR